MVQLAEFERSNFSEERELTERSPLRSSPPSSYSRPSSSRLSPFVGSYSNCDSVDELCDRLSRYHRQVRDMLNFGSIQIDEETRDIINQVGSVPGNKPPLLFHEIHGSNVMIMKNGRMAKRKESFCKGLAFSSRPIEIDENICLRLCEVGTSWSGVLRFGVTNEDPEQYRSIPVPTFACPDLTTKDGYWAKALPERYSTQGNILHFYVNQQGELFYGINGTQKGMFLTGINVRSPIWLILDIYGNSVAVEIYDASEFQPRRNAPPPPQIFPPLGHRLARPVPLPAVAARVNSPNFESSSASRTDDSGVTPIRFHHVKGCHITLNPFRNIATRDQAEYSQGYVFTERPIKNNEKVMIQITEVQRLYEGGLAFGVTCCDPATIRVAELPEDSSDLVEMPEYWVGIKDIALQPKANSILSFWITDSGEVKFEVDSNGARTCLHVDNSLKLYMYFDVYGSTIGIRLMGCLPVLRSHSPSARELRESSSRSDRNDQPLSIPKRPARIMDPSSSSLFAPPALPARPPPAPHSPLRVNIRDSLESSSSAPTFPRTTIDDLLLGDLLPRTAPPPVAPRTTIASSASTSRLPSRPTTSAMMSPPAFSPPPLPTSFQNLAVSSGNDKEGEAPGEGDECTICMDAPVNSVLYTCGHMCMCFDCGRRLLTTKGTCPICRAPVQDVIKTYKS
ncbi:hypothetical protein GCK72_023415 [Caenorhabditis remanei]|uniref:RING-type E3 ubiquitin transferase n=1 Tax=Caenorhabditis remanei TaxID=31234 RepID=A0A6A5FWS7_CAERE|nr:hypothetical protein GCK72_023415 [Caenorhabditis remanei]KAF1746957.1 hypothetical protein GCK72_023415 [Caenorhabditis remanei]